MIFNVWKTRVFLIFILSIGLAIIVAFFSGQPEAKPIDTSILPAVPVAQEENINTKIQLLQNQSKDSSVTSLAPRSTKNTSLNYRPRYQISWANPLNYGDRYTRDIYGKPVYNQPIIVLHETVYSAASAINMFQTPHRNEKDQASYHTLIKLDGTIVYIVPPDKRAFGATNSVFVGFNGSEAVKTHPNFAASVNNFAYHVSLETPLDGRNSQRRHSGYTEAEYQSLAWLIAQSKVPDARITTHKAVDRSGSRIDPRSFNQKKFLTLLHSMRRQSINS